MRRVSVWFLISGAAAALAVLHARWAATAAVLAAAVALTVVEMIQSAVSWELSVALAPAHAQGSYVGVHGLAQSTASCLGPLLMTSVVIAAKPGRLARPRRRTRRGRPPPAAPGAPPPRPDGRGGRGRPIVSGSRYGE